MTSVLLSEVGRGEAAQGATIPNVPLTPEEVGARIARAREAKAPKPWSQFDLALALGVSPSTIYRWEKGKLPSMNELIRLADALDQPVSYLSEPPERLTELADVKRQVDECLVHLEQLRVESERMSAAMTESLASIDVRLSQIEASLGLLDGRDSEAHP